LLSNKQITQLKQYNKSFNEFLKNLGQKPTKISEINVNENISRLKQFYKNEGYFTAIHNVLALVIVNLFVLLA
jgi:ASC-1-like (ASCH) protein